MDAETFSALIGTGIKTGGAGLQALLHHLYNNRNDKFKSKKKLEEFLASEELKKLHEKYSRHAIKSDKKAKKVDRKEHIKQAEQEYDQKLKELKKKYEGQSHRKSKTGYNDEKQLLKKNRDELIARYNMDDVSQLQKEYNDARAKLSSDLESKLNNLQREELEYKATGKAPEWFGDASSSANGLSGIGTYSTLTPDQQKASGSILQQGLEGIGRVNSSFAPIAQKYRNEFSNQIAPGIAQKFAGLGALGSGAYLQAQNNAGQELAQNLSAAEQGYNQKELEYYKSLVDRGLKPQIESYYKPGDAAAGANQYAGVSNAFNAIGTGVEDILNARSQSQKDKASNPQQPQVNNQTNGIQQQAEVPFNPEVEQSLWDLTQKKYPALKFS